MTSFRYAAFGLCIESGWAIPSLVACGDSLDKNADVVLVEGSVRLPEGMEEVDGIKVKVEGGSCYLDIDECGRFLLERGRRIIAQFDPEATREEGNLYLLGSVFGALLHQRKAIPLHCNAVEVDGRAFLVCGDSGAGKSTLAAYFVNRGFRLLSDDLCALCFDEDGKLLALPGAARLKLWQETLDRLGRSSTGLKRVPWYDDKFEVALDGDAIAGTLPVAGLYHLRIAQEGRPRGIHPLKGLDAANAITANIYRRRLADLMGTAPFYLSSTVSIIAQTPVFTINREWGFDHFAADALKVEEHMRELASGFGHGRYDGSETSGSKSTMRA